jgi:hypothetical protein
MNYLAFQSFDFERTWWRSFQKRFVRTKFDIYVFITMRGQVLMKPTLWYILFLYFQLAISDALPVIVNSNDVNTNSAGEELGATANIEQLISVRSVREMGYTMEDIIPAYTEVVSHHSKFTLKLHYKTNQYRNDKNGCYENYYWLSVV